MGSVARQSGTRRHRELGIAKHNRYDRTARHADVCFPAERHGKEISVKFRAQWYREQREAMETIRLSKKPVGRKRRAPNAPETWLSLRRISTRLSRTLEDLLQVMHEQAPGERSPEITVSLIADLAEGPPTTIEPPARSKPVNPMGRHRIALGGKVEANNVIARLEVTAKVTVWAAPGAARSDEMTRSTWCLPLEGEEKREKRYEKRRDEK